MKKSKKREKRGKRMEKMKEQKGSVTLFVLVTCLFMITVLLLVNIGMINKNQSQEKEIIQISKNYSVNETDLANSYAKIAEENRYPTYEEVEKMIEKMKCQCIPIEEIRKEIEQAILVERTNTEKTIAELEKTLQDTIERVNTIKTEIDHNIEIAKSEAKLEAFPVGSIYVSTTPANPSTYIGGTWESYGQGRTLVGAGTGTDSNNTSLLFKTGERGGEYAYQLTTAQLPSHMHTLTPVGTITSTFKGSSVTTSTTGEHQHTINITNTQREANGYGLSLSTSFQNRVMVTEGSTSVGTNGSHSHTVTAKGSVSSTFTGTKGNTSSVGSGTAINQLQPYIVTYMWKRIS